MASNVSPPPTKKFGRDRTHAVTGKSSSASIKSKLEDPFNYNLKVVGRDSMANLKECEMARWYNLAGLTQSRVFGRAGISDKVCLEYLKSLFPEPKYSCVNTEVKEFKCLPSFICSEKQKPGTSVYLTSKNIPVLLVEVLSSPYESSIRKVIIGVIDQLRLYRMTNPNTNSCVGFAFPRLPQTADNKQSVIQVKVTWEKFTFVYDLQPLQLADVPAALTTAVKINESLIREHLQASTQNFVVRLSTEDLHLFGDGAVQISSTSAILVETDQEYYKLPIVDAPNCYLYMGVKSPHAVKLQIKQMGLAHFFVSPRQPHDPLDRCEARDCLFDLVKKVACEISGLHHDGWAHQDVHLENICFTKDYEPILIDLDRVCSVDDLPTLYIHLVCTNEALVHVRWTGSS